MSYPPPPPQNQPPNHTPGGYGPPAGGYGQGVQGQGGYGQGGYGPPAGGQPGGYGPPAGGGYGPPGPGGPGGWQQPGGPPGGGGNGKTIAAIIGGGVLVVAAVIVAVVMANGGDEEKVRAHPSGSRSATPSDSASATPSATPTDTGFTSTPSPTSSKIPFFQLKVGDCFDRPAGGVGNNDRASCNGPHDAEVVTIHRLGSGFTTSSAIKAEASSLCKDELESKARRQPAGTAEGTYVQFPNIRGYKMGIKTVSCSLMGNRTGTKKLTKPLS
ncbi:hypothetical protein [Streptomyces halobius]|uniref:Septum formation-related domain-containing protein n=1 Tax=Streptomyces halobius TaxID=2879846 RepID=A0ABY4M1T2_9ACTN|nr:hypothetical protein [Streptomyces halobius]UQA91680.1 hypothetical protein K9S39_07215 [Streptomyces halobius]